MIFDDINDVELFVDDFKELRKLWKKSKRILNSNKYFSAPLMVSAHQLKHLNKINELKCDAIIINLEDGVAPELKTRALHLAALFITHLDQCDKKIIVRVNPLDEGGIEEIQFLNQVNFDAIRVPKVKNDLDVKKALALIDNGAELHLSIETKEAWLNLHTLAIDARVTTFYLGVLDFFADLGLTQELIKVDNPMMHYLLSHFLITTRSVGCQAVSFVYQDYKDLETFTAWLKLEKQLGYSAKGVVSPDQAHLAMKVFVKDKLLLARARHIVKRFEEESKKGNTGFTDETYGFIDEPIYKGALVELEGEKS